jgi:hypothetical protein
MRPSAWAGRVLQGGESGFLARFALEHHAAGQHHGDGFFQLFARLPPYCACRSAALCSGGSRSGRRRLVRACGQLGAALGDDLVFVGAAACSWISVVMVFFVVDY